MDGGGQTMGIGNNQARLKTTTTMPVSSGPSFVGAFMGPQPRRIQVQVPQQQQPLVCKHF